MEPVRPDSTETIGLLERIRRGQKEALSQLLARSRPELEAFVGFHLDAKVRGRIDPSDVVQETQLEVVRRIDDFLERRPMPFHLWLRKTAYERMLQTRRDHRVRARRSVDRERPWPDQSSLLLARPLLSKGPSPSKTAEAREFAERVSRAVSELADDDRQILLMRQVEDLPYDEIGCLLDIAPAAARKRFGRALLRLRETLIEHGLLGDVQ
jgi:RNA polymerase sigma-70 factor (ECF subfamily)